ncbi:MAG TPA: LemA family protein [Polyangiaceae bacterium]|jgi:LemA protein|nr:LemA family protein [Polyangiaceae bacterium]
MGTGLIIGIVLLLGIVLSIGYVIAIFNRLVTLRERHRNAFSQIEIQLKRRYDLIPNLVETAKGYLAHEKQTLTAVIEARNVALAGLKAAAAGPGDPAAMKQLGSAEGALAGALGRMSVVMEQYPDLKANQNMMQLTEELTSTENKVAFARQAFNDAVTAYNIYKQTFPPVVIASMTGHSQNAALLEFEDSKQIQAAPQVKF